MVSCLIITFVSFLQGELHLMVRYSSECFQKNMVYVF